MADDRDRQLARLEQENAALRAENADLRAQVEQLTRQLNEVLAEFRRLTGRNDPRPGKGPSSTAGSKPERAKSARKRGGQPGHPKHERALVPPDEVDEIHDCVPEECENCRARLDGTDEDPERHQVWSLPEIRARVAEYRQHALGCGQCGHVTRGKLPPGVPSRAFAANVVALVAVLMGSYRLGKRPVQALLADLFRLPMSLGAVIGCQKQASEALKTPYTEACESARRRKVKYVDETSWREAGRWVWLWAMATEKLVVFRIQARRTADAARSFLGRAVAYLVSDRAGAYGWWDMLYRQFCWAHLARDFAKIEKRGGESGEIGHALGEIARQLFHYWHRVRDGTMTRENFHRHVLTGSQSLQARTRALLEQGLTCGHESTERTCENLLRSFPSLWTFVEVPGIEPTNNDAERSVRHGVIYRKLSGGTQSSHGSRFVERMMTVDATLRRQDRNVLAFVREACEARLRNNPPPSLLVA